MTADATTSGEAAHHALDRQPAKDPAKSNQPNPTQEDAPPPQAVHNHPGKPITATPTQPDALRPSSANDSRNKNKVEPLHLSAGADETPAHNAPTSPPPPD